MSLSIPPGTPTPEVEAMARAWAKVSMWSSIANTLQFATILAFTAFLIDRCSG